MSLGKDLLDLVEIIIDIIREGFILAQLQRGMENANTLVEEIDYNPEDYE